MAVMVYRFVRRKSGKGKNWEDVQNPQKTEPNIRWKWRGLRWLLAYLGFWLVAGGGAGVIARSTSPEIQGGASSFVTLIVIIFLIWCAVKDRGNKTTPQKVGWVVGIWIAHAIASLIVTFALAGAGIGEAGNLQRMGNMIAGFIILYFAMRRSTVFVEQVTSVKE